MTYTLKNLREVGDAAAAHGMSDVQESRFARGDLEAEGTGLAHHHLLPGKRQPFGHVHHDAEEVVVVLSGSGRAKLDDDLVELSPLDALRLSPGVKRRFEAGPEGMEFLVFGPHVENDGELLQDFWAE
jgi:quercetin dioxygenase-like cupin family protein